MKELVNLEYEGNPVRMVEIDGVPWWVLADVCRVLEIKNPRMAAHRLDEDEKSTVSVPDGRAGHGPQSFTVINESGMNHLVLLSRKPKAKDFRKWVTGTVLPSIRQHGAYIEPAASIATPVTREMLAELRQELRDELLGELRNEVRLLGATTRAETMTRSLEFQEGHVAGEGFRVCDAIRRMIGGGKWPSDVNRRAVAQKLTADLMRHYRLTGHPVVTRGHERYFPRLATIELTAQWWTELLEHGRRVANGQQPLATKWPSQRKPINEEKQALEEEARKKRGKKGDVAIH